MNNADTWYGLRNMLIFKKPQSSALTSHGKCADPGAQTRVPEKQKLHTKKGLLKMRSGLLIALPWEPFLLGTILGVKCWKNQVSHTFYSITEQYSTYTSFHFQSLVINTMSEDQYRRKSKQLWPFSCLTLLQLNGLAEVTERLRHTAQCSVHCIQSLCIYSLS